MKMTSVKANVPFGEKMAVSTVLLLLLYVWTLGVQKVNGQRLYSTPTSISTANVARKLYTSVTCPLSHIILLGS